MGSTESSLLAAEVTFSGKQSYLAHHIDDRRVPDILQGACFNSRRQCQQIIVCYLLIVVYHRNRCFDEK